MYVNLFPCNECAKMIIQAGIRQIIYISDKYPEDEKFITARRMFRLAGVQTTQMPLPKKKIEIDFERFL
jgi:dCMP deaminase